MQAGPPKNRRALLYKEYIKKMRKNKRATSYYNTKTNKYAVVDKGQVKVYDVTRSFGQTIKMKFIKSYVIESLTQDELIKLTERRV